jgi:hypothetical protein
MVVLFIGSNAARSTFNVGQEFWVVGSDKMKANVKAVELLKQKGYSKDTSFELIKVVYSKNIRS